MFETLTTGRLALVTAQPDGSGPDRPPILFIPGLFAGAWVFDTFLGFFAERGHPGYALNLRGREGSPLAPGERPGRVSVRDYVADADEAAAWIEARASRPIIVGHSMGGLIAQQLAAEGRARAAVLLSPAPPRGISVLSRGLLARQWRYLGKLLRSRPLFPRWGDARKLLLNRVPEKEQRTQFSRLVPDSGRAARELSLGAIAISADRLRENECPVLVVASDEDRFIPSRVVERVATRYRAPLFLARGHGHLLMQEPGWQETAAFIEDWLERHVDRD
ncbi:MAG TPA: alpha/beta hydrolase [Gemmatimonadaceae bacterium]|nr:alpha/beta hydrolase [Gemmatimonadaceae bacterium]